MNFARTTSISLALVALSAACTFPDVQIGTGGAGTASASGSGGATTKASASASASGATSTATSGSAATGASSSTGSGACEACLATTNCDCDGDTVPRYDPAHQCMGVGNDPTKSDCNDCEGDVFPGQTKYFTAPIPGVQPPAAQFDYDCNGKDDPKYVEGPACTSLSKLGMGGCAHDYANATVACGAMVNINHCADPGALATQCVTGSSDPTSLPCH